MIRSGTGKSLSILDSNGITWHTISGYKIRENLFSNPSFETASGTVNVRTNLATNPSFETASGTATVRTNLAPNPSFEAGTSMWTYGANWGPESSADRAVFGTKSLKATRSNTTVGNGYMSMTAASMPAGTTVTFSAYLYGGTGSYSLMGGGVAAPAVPSVTFAAPGNAWVRQSLTFTTTVTGTLDLYIHDDANANPTTGSVLYVDGVLAEVSPMLSDYFDGSTTASGDFTYAWTGTANASTSVQTAPGVAGWSVESNVILYRSALNSYVGTFNGVAVKKTPGGSQSGFSCAIPTTVGQSYTIQARIKAITGTPTVTFTNTVVGGPGVVTSSVWQVYSFTFTATVTNSILAFTASSGNAGDSYAIDAFLFEESPVLGTYFDGATAAAGDFTYAWSGTANASTSYQQAPGVARIAAYWAGVDLVGFQAPSAAMRGTKGMRFQAIRPSTFLYGTDGANGTTVTPGESVTFSYNVRPSVTRDFRISVGYDGPATHYGAWISCPANVWTRVSTTAVVPVGATLATVYFNSETLSTTGDIYDIDCVLIEKSAFLEDYFDGSTAADEYFTYSWAGTAHASKSIATP